MPNQDQASLAAGICRWTWMRQEQCLVAATGWTGGSETVPDRPRTPSVARLEVCQQALFVRQLQHRGCNFIIRDWGKSWKCAISVNVDLVSGTGCSSIDVRDFPIKKQWKSVALMSTSATFVLASDSVVQWDSAKMLHASEWPVYGRLVT